MVMKQRFILFRRAGVFYCEDTATHKQFSLRRRNEAEANPLFHAKNESFRQPVLNLQIARIYPGGRQGCRNALGQPVWAGFTRRPFSLSPRCPEKPGSQRENPL